MAVLLSPVFPARNVNHQTVLINFLESGVCPAHTMDFYQLDGYLCAVAFGPGDANPPDFLPLVFNGQQPTYMSKGQEKEVTDAIQALYAFYKAHVFCGQLELPCVPFYSVNRNDRINLEQWARGFMQGYIFWEDSWNVLLDEIPQATETDLSVDAVTAELDGILQVISIIADADLALQQGTKPSELEQIFASVPEVLINYAQLGSRLNRTLLQHAIVSPLVDMDKC